MMHLANRLIVPLTLLYCAYLGGSLNAQTTSNQNQASSNETSIIQIEKQAIPVFQYFVFYDQRLEILMGPRFQFTGSVFSNDDSYLAAFRGIDFNHSFETAGQLFHDLLTVTSQSAPDAPINFKDNNGISQPMENIDDWFDPQNVYDYRWLDSKTPDFLELAEARWGGQVQTKEFGVRPFDSGFGLHRHIDPRLPIGDLRPDGSINEVVNPGYALIEPMLNQNDLAFKGCENELKKIAAQACLVAKLTHSDAPLTLWKYVYESGSIVYDVSGMPLMVQVELPDGLLGAAVAGMNGIEPFDYGSVEHYEEDPGSGEVVRGLYDARERKAMDLVSIDISRLRELVDPSDSNYISFADAACPWEGTFNPEEEWNGILYVQFPTNPEFERWGDRIVTASDPNLALQMINAYEMPSDGLFIGTNAPFYSVGNVNSDGYSDTGSSTQPDDYYEPAVGFAGECFNILSEEWQGSRRYSNSSNSRYRRSVDTEFSGAILTGIVPTDSQGRYSGGFANAFRFLEDWRDQTLTYRGAVAALFECEVHTAPLRSYAYDPPRRNYGYNDLFRYGFYPPFVPTLSRNRVPRIVVKEIMYAPAALTQKELDAGFTDPEEFEFIRLYNAEKNRVDATGIVLEGEINYAFDPNVILMPQSSFFLVKNKAAFTFRYGDDSQVVGSYSGNLSNQRGVFVILGSRGQVLNELIQVVYYDSESPWPLESAGYGHSLVQSHLSYERSLTDLAHWQASTAPLGFPAQVSSYDYDSWLEEHFTEEQINAGLQTEYLLDLEKDGFSNLMEYALGLNPFEFNSSSFVKYVPDDATSDGYIDFAYRYLPGVSDIAYKVKQSSDLSTWTPAASYVQSITDNGDGTKTMNLRQPVIRGQSVFFTLEIDPSP